MYGSGNPSKLVKQKLIEYNEDDSLALKHIVKHIESGTRSSPQVAGLNSGVKRRFNSDP